MERAPRPRPRKEEATSARSHGALTRMKIAIIGLGSIGRRHLGNFHAIGVETLHAYDAARGPACGGRHAVPVRARDADARGGAGRRGGRRRLHAARLAPRDRAAGRRARRASHDREAARQIVGGRRGSAAFLRRKRSQGAHRLQLALLAADAARRAAPEARAGSARCVPDAPSTPTTCSTPLPGRRLPAVLHGRRQAGRRLPARREPRDRLHALASRRDRRGERGGRARLEPRDRRPTTSPTSPCASPRARSATST